LETIRSLELLDGNYAIALDLLQNGFDNRRLVFQAHITEILGLNAVQSGSVSTSALPTTSTALIAQEFNIDIVLLATASVLVKNRSGVFVPCRALLDSGYQLHLITSRFANQLQVKKIKSSASVTGIGDSSFVTDSHSVNITIQSRTSEYSAKITAVIAPNITERQPSFNVDIGELCISCQLTSIQRFRVGLR